MIIIDLIYNLALLVALSVLSGFVGHRWKNRRREALLQGLVFGGTAVIGMLHPTVLGPGLIFDGRSVVISLCGLFFGPAAVSVAGLMALICRVVQGGIGARMGVVVIVASALLGVIFHNRRTRQGAEVSNWQLLLFGVLVQLAMFASAFTLPTTAALSVLQQIALPVLLTYPVATVLIGKVLSDQIARSRFVDALWESREEVRTTLYSIGDAVITTDKEGLVRQMNPEAERLTGWLEAEADSRPLDEVFRIVNEGTRKTVESPVERVLREGRAVGLANHTVLIARDGTERPISDSGAPIRNVNDSVSGVVLVFSDRTAHRAAERALQESELKYRTLANSGQALIWTSGLDKKCDYFNEPWLAFTGRSLTQELGDGWTEGVHPDDRDRCFETYAGTFDRREGFSMEYRLRRHDGEYRWLQDAGTPRYDSKGIFLGYIGHCLDNTEHKRIEKEREALEKQYRQAQKMESVGRLAGGVAHDFNNLLTVINGYSELLLGKLSADDALRPNVDEIRKAGSRAEGLTRQLLAFSRKQVLQPRVLDLNQVVSGIRSMLERLVGEDVEVRVELHSESATVRADPHQLEQVLMNLAVNARDAMQHGGKLLIETAMVELGESYYRSHPEARAGRFVTLTVSDDGMGISEEIRAHIFEPFFTTKKVGDGTGLGLSMVQGIVAQSGGFIEVSSELGHGTTFKLYLPAVSEAVVDGDIPLSIPALGGKETVLVVEDQLEVREYTAIALQDYGYCVIAAESASEALLFCKQNPQRIDLVLSDVVMPNISGRELAEELTILQPGIKVMLMSGYMDDAIISHGVLDAGIEFIQKPFTPRQLAIKVRQVLDPPRRSASILIVDDEAAVRSFLRSVLEQEGYEVVEAIDGKRGLQQASARRFDLVVTDLIMPEQEGIETIQALRREMPGIGIIAISGNIGGPYLKIAASLGADAALAKPIRADLLLATTAEILRTRM